jgi:serine/threonine-protein kinase
MPQYGQYTTEREIAQSERFSIYQARHAGTQEVVALKVLRDPRQGDRFMHMARLASILQDPHTVRQTDATPDFVALELVDGPNLKTTIVRGAVAPAAAISIVKQLCVAIAYAHSAGIVHGRISPTHLMHGPLLRIIGHRYYTGDKAVLDPDVVKYVPPESLRLAAVDERTDIWSIGVVLFELVEGYKPFDAESYAELTAKLAADPPATAMRMSPALSLVVARCLEKRPERRFQSIAELSNSLQSLL